MTKKRLDVFILVLSSIVILTATASVVRAGNDPVKLIVPIGAGANPLESASEGPATYVITFYRWSIGLAALLAMAQLVVGGLQYVLAAGSISSKETANERMRSAVTGLIILLAIVLILTTINPRLLEISSELK